MQLATLPRLSKKRTRRNAGKGINSKKGKVYAQMIMGKRIDEITVIDLQNLIGTQESNTLEFKERLPTSKEDDEFLADTSSFANANGGYIVYGMVEDKLVAKRLDGLGNIDPDQAIQRMENLANSGIEPRIPGLRFRSIRLQDGSNTVILVYIPQSLAAPHQVSKTARFYKRYSVKKQPMNVAELRSAFSLSGAFVERIQQFRSKRLEIISVNDYREPLPIKLDAGARFVLHVIPFASVQLANSPDLSRIQQPDTSQTTATATTYRYGGRYNLEGFVVPHDLPGETGSYPGYSQIFRNGAIEHVQTLVPESPSLLRHDLSPSEQNRLGYMRYLRLNSVEDMVLTYLAQSLDMCSLLEISTPLVVMLSLLKVRTLRLSAFSLGSLNWYQVENLPVIVLDNALMPDIILTDSQADLRLAAKPLFDVLWNLAGLARSQSYDDQGNWIRI